MLFQIFIQSVERESVLKYVIYFNFSNFLPITFLFIPHEGNVLKHFISVLILLLLPSSHLQNFPVIHFNTVWSYIFTVIRKKILEDYFVKLLLKSSVHLVRFLFLQSGEDTNPYLK